MTTHAHRTLNSYLHSTVCTIVFHILIQPRLRKQLVFGIVFLLLSIFINHFFGITSLSSMRFEYLDTLMVFIGPIYISWTIHMYSRVCKITKSSTAKYTSEPKKKEIKLDLRRYFMKLNLKESKNRIPITLTALV